MRLNRLDLTRYGKFTETSLNFDRPNRGGPDLHVIHGANEAGKSTLFEGWLDFLFQIPLRSPMNFLHPYKVMQLGAQLTVDGQDHDLVRIKKRDGSLLNGQGDAVGEALLQAGLRGLGRGSYTAMFSLNRQTLDEGGESILASEGDLGQLLFQASAGMTDLSGQLMGLRDDLDQVLSPSGRKGRLRDLREAFEALGEEIKALDTAAPEFARLGQMLEQARMAWQEARQRAKEAQEAKARLQRQLDALPLARRLNALGEQIDAQGDLPEVPASWLEELAERDRDQTEITTLQSQAQGRVVELEQALSARPSDDLAIQAAPAIERAQRLKSAHDTAIDDLPKRHHELAGFHAEIADVLTRLGQPGTEPAELLPPAGVVGKLRGLIETHSGVQAAYAAAQDEVDKARAELTRAEAGLASLGAGVGDLDGLGRLVQRLRTTDPQGALGRSQEALRDAQDGLDRAVARLRPWQGDPRALAGIVSPPREDMDALAREMILAERLIQRGLDDQDRCEAELREALQDAEAAQAGGAMTPEQAAQTRAHREAAWAAHRVRLDAVSADQFEATLRLDDQATAELADHKARLVQASDLAQRVARKEQQAEEAKVALDRAQALRRALCDRLGTMLQATDAGLPDDMTLAGFTQWLSQLEQARDALLIRDKAARDTAVCQTAHDHAKSELSRALEQAGKPLMQSVELLAALDGAQSLLDQAAEIRARAQAAQSARLNLEQRERVFSDRSAQRQEWADDWAATCARTWLTTPPDVPAMRAILDALDRLQSLQEKRQDREHRIETMTANQARFDDEVAALASTLGMASEQSKAVSWAEITMRLRRAQETETARQDLSDRLEKARDDLVRINARAQLHCSRLDEFAALLGTTTWEETRDALTRARVRQTLQRQQVERAEELCGLMQAASPTQALARLGDADEPGLKAQIETLDTDLTTLSAAQEATHAAFRDAERALEAVGGDDAVARLQARRQTLLLQMEDMARDQLRQRLGLVVVERALRRYRDTHRSAMLSRASQAFSTMSLGRYTALTTQPDGTREVLVAQDADGGSKQADQLSEGTRAQLYLALRIAGYHEFTRNNGPVPFIADDIMESFDDDRAHAALGLLADMSRSGQVIYLTHHAHIRDLAAHACSQARIHELPG